MVSRYLKNVFSKTNEFLLYGNVRKLKKSLYEFQTEIRNDKDFKPIFFLSTGRTGTDFFTKLLQCSSVVKAFHSPSTLFCNSEAELIQSSKIVYEQYSQHGLKDNTVNDLASQLFIETRENLLYKTFLHKKKYIETNNKITFFAPAIKYILPNAKFVHLYRHPGDFIRSGVRREYYKSQNIHEIGRLKPTPNNKYFAQWKEFDEIEKIAWLWNETNMYIEKYLKFLDQEDYMQLNFNTLSVETVNDLLSFLEIDDIKTSDIEALIHKPTNVQKYGTFPKYNEWKEEDKQKVQHFCKKLSSKYGYEL